jgi:two-component system chemotaxis response regulator CheY
VGKSILVADSDTGSLELLCRLLKIFGYDNITKAEDGLDALFQVTQKAPDLVVVDANLPKLDGFLLAEILHNVTRFREISVVLMSTSMNTATMEKGMLAGAYAFLEKPLTPEGVKSVLGGASAPQAIYPENMSKPSQAVVSEFSEAAKRMLNLIFGQPAKVLKVDQASAEFLAKTWDYTAQVTLEGAAKIELSLGVSAEVVKAISLGLGKKDQTQGALGQALGNLLSSVVDRAIGRVNETYAVKPGQVQVAFGSTFNTGATPKERYVVQLRVAMQSAILRKQLSVPLLVGLSPR